MIPVKTGTRTGPSAIVLCVQSRGTGTDEMQVQLRQTGVVFSSLPPLIHLSLFLLPWKYSLSFILLLTEQGVSLNCGTSSCRQLRLRLSGYLFLSPCPPCQLYLYLSGIKSQSSGHLRMTISIFSCSEFISVLWCVCFKSGDLKVNNGIKY